MGAGIDPLWRKAPFTLFGFRGLLVGQVIAGALLAIAVATGPMFLSATANAAIDSSIARTDRFTSGFSLSISNDLLHQTPRGPVGLDYRELNHRLDDATSGLDHLGPRVSTLISDSAVAHGPRTSASYPIRTIARTGALDHVHRLSGTPGDTDGLWIPDVVAHELDVGVSDRLTLVASGRRVHVRVAGIYRNLINTVLEPFWSPLVQQINPLNPVADPPPPLLIGTRASVLELSRNLHQSGAFFQWDYPVATRPALTFDDATNLSRGFNTLAGNLGDPRSPLGRSLACPFCVNYGRLPNIAFGLQTAIEAARAQVDSLRQPVAALISAAALVALVTIGATGGYGASRRRAEQRLLLVRGWSGAKIALKSTVESVIPAVLGAALGYVAALAVIASIGPGGSVTTSVYGLVAATIPVALIVLFAATAALASRATLTQSPARRRSARLWEVIPLALGIASFYWARTDSARFTSNGGSTVRDVVLLLGVPIFLILGVAGLAARAFRHLLGAAATRADRLRPSMYLAVRRLVSAGTLLTGMLVGSVLAVGIASYGQTMASSMRATTTAKASVFTGGDVAVTTQPQYDMPDSFPFPTTQAYQFSDGASVGPTDTSVGLIAVDPATLAAAIRWYPSFSDTPLSDILRDLKAPSSNRLPVVAVGGLSSVSSLELSGASIPAEVVDRASAFPGMFGTKPWVVVDEHSLGPAAEAAGGSDPIGNLQPFSPTWVRGDPTSVTAALGRLGFVPSDVLTTAQVLDQPAYLAATRTFRILRAIGLVSALLAATAILLYIQARQRSRAVVTALSTRMGLSRASQLWAAFGELAALLACAVGFGSVIGIAATTLIHSRADPLPALPPPPLLDVSVVAIVPILVAAVALAAIGAVAAQLGAERTNFAEAMRHAD